MIRNQKEDAERGVQFIPDGWTREDMFTYAKRNLKQADEYIKVIKTRNILLFCRIPLALAKKTLKAMENGKEKMSRNEVEDTVEDIINKK
jgi:farnesyl-diphosphate farnesyltransferase